jgi:aminomuconate-semialdehyde/2-hydroxymuconate-6-semialdehyde dehydrogenase
LETTLKSSFSNQGQICLCNNRILVEASIYERFKEEFVTATSKLRVGNPMHTNVSLGSIVSKSHFEKIMDSISEAQKEGGTILFGGKAVQVEAPCDKGYFIEPTIIEGLDANTQTNKNEIFGPVVTLQPFATEEEALQLANATDYGLAATIWTESLGRAKRFALQIHFGVVWINCWMQRDMRTPFGGIKNSGLGREGGWEAMRFFTEPKNVCIAF